MAIDWNQLRERTGRTLSDLTRKSKGAAQNLNDSEFAAKARKSTFEAASFAREKAAEGQEWASKQIRKRTEPTSPKNWYLRAADACDTTSDAVMREQSGVSSKLSKALAGKLGVAGTTAGIFSVASLLGTASTGTAIGTLSGAAFTSASLAWIGGSVAMGSIIVSVAAVSGGIGAALGAGWALKKYVWGSKRKPTELEEQEQKVISACIALSAGFRQQAQEGRELDPESAKALYADALQPLCDELRDIHAKVNSWPYMARKKLENACKGLQKSANFAGEQAKRHPNVTTGTVSAVFIQLLADGDLPAFNENEQLVLEALRRSNSLLATATDNELAEYIQGMEPNQLQGLQNNVKGIYHELRFARDYSANEDQYAVELFEATNHPGADVRIINLETGEVREIQLKATGFMSHIRAHNDRYESVDLFAISELADTSDSISSTGMSNAELTGDVSNVVSGLGDVGESNEVLNSMALAGVVALARHTRVLLKGGNMSEEDKRRVLESGVVSAGAAGVVSLLIG